MGIFVYFQAERVSFFQYCEQKNNVMIHFVTGRVDKLLSLKGDSLAEKCRTFFAV